MRPNTSSSFKLLEIFLEAKSDKEGRKWNNPDEEVVDLCAYMEAYWAGNIILKVDGEVGKPIDLLESIPRQGQWVCFRT